MRILHLFASPFWTGPAENIALLAIEQRALGHEVHVAIDRLRTDHTSEEPGAPRFGALGLLDEGGLELSVKSPPWRLRTDARLLSKRSVDVVHCHFSHDHYVARLGRPGSARVIRSIHAPRSLRWSTPTADAWTVPTITMARRLVGKRVAVLQPLLGDEFRPPEDRAALKREMGLSGDLAIGMVSTFQRSRHHDIGVEAFRRLHAVRDDARLVLVGDGTELAATRARVKAGGIEGVTTFAGYQSGSAFVRWLQALDVVWILGLGNDWSGRAAAQARACDVRVVAVDEGALPEWADEIVPLEPEPIASSALGTSRIQKAVHTNRTIAEDVIRLYEARWLPV